MPQSGIDLHAHTTASDGSLKPAELAQRAAQRGLAAIAVTDHDTLDGIADATRAGQELGVEIVPGIELSLEYPGHFHLLGYLFRPDDAALTGRIRYLQEFRASRNDRMVQKMQDYGLPVTLEEVRARSGGDLIGRPHMALTLVDKGIVQTVQEAFDRFLADGKPCHVPKEKVMPDEGMRLIREAGGLPVIAHPMSLKLSAQALEAELKRLRGLGLGGVECYYSQHNPEQVALLLELSKKLGLLATGGSDFHGASKPHIQLGDVNAGQPASGELLDRMKQSVGWKPSSRAEPGTSSG